MNIKTFLIGPVRGYDENYLSGVVERIESGGYKVYWPARDTPQNDESGLAICLENMRAIASSDVVHVVWDGVSQGCLFDLGMAFALGKSVIPVSLPDQTDGKSFQNMVRAWHESRSTT